jgi:hypothetical protein
MVSGRTWAIKGVSDRTRDAVLEAAHAEGLMVGEWVDRALAKAAEEARHPQPPAASREDVAEVVRELLDERLAALTDRVERTTRAAAGEGASPVAAVRARLRQRRAP